MALFSMSGVLRGFLSAAYYNVRLNKNPCVALLIEKKISFLNWKVAVFKINFWRWLVIEIKAKVVVVWKLPKH